MTTDLGALAQLRAQGELAAVQFDQPLDDRQAEAGPLLGILLRQRAAPERGQDDRNLLLGNAGAGVPDRQILPAVPVQPTLMAIEPPSA